MTYEQQVVKNTAAILAILNSAKSMHQLEELPVDMVSIDEMPVIQKNSNKLFKIAVNKVGGVDFLLSNIVGENLVKTNAKRVQFDSDYFNLSFISEHDIIYISLSDDMVRFVEEAEITFNKQNNLNADETGNKYPTIDAVRTHTTNTNNPHSVTKTQVGLENVTNDAQIPLALKGSPLGVAELDAQGFVLNSQLPSYVDDVLEFANLASFPVTGESGKIYIAIDTNITYRWSGTVYAPIGSDLALGETALTAYRGDRGKIGYDHSQSAHAPSDAQKNSDITKAEIEDKLIGEIISHTHPGGILEIVTVVGTTYTFLLTDAQKKVLFTSATAVSATIPTNATTAIPIGSKIEVTQSGAGIVTLVTTGLTITSATIAPITLVAGQTVYLVKTAINSWTIDLNIEASGAQTISGVKTFLASMFGLRNTANTFTSFFASAVTASRTWTFPDKAGTVAMTSDIVAQLNGAVNYLVKFGTATTGVVSRLWDTGTFLGIGVVNSPTKDIALGNQGNRDIGVEFSNSTTVGRDLIISAGVTVNYQLNTDFILLHTANSVSSDNAGVAIDINNNVYYACRYDNIYRRLVAESIFSVYSGTGYQRWTLYVSPITNNLYVGDYNNLLVQYNCTGAFVNILNGFSQYIEGIVVSNNGDLYITYGNAIFIQYGETGAFVNLNEVNRAYRGFYTDANNNIYVGVSGADIFKRTNNAGAFVAEGVTARSWRSFTRLPNNDVYGTIGAGDIFRRVNNQGNFIAMGVTQRDYRGIQSDINGNVYAGGPGALYFQNNSGAGTPNLKGGTLKLRAGTGKGTGQSRLEFITGQKTASGTDMQLETVREYLTEDGHHVYTSMPTYEDNASAIAGGLVVGTQYRTSTGILMIVY
jgi:hypothetical protein